MFFSPFKYTSGFNPKRLFWGITSSGDDDAYGFRRNLTGDQSIASNILKTVTGFISSPRTSIAKYSYNDFLMVGIDGDTSAGYAGIGTTAGTGGGSLYTDTSVFSDFTFDDAGHLYVTGGNLGLGVMDIPGFTNRNEYSWTSGIWKNGQIAWVPVLDKLIVTNGSPNNTDPYSIGRSDLIGDVETDAYIEVGTSNGVVVVNEEFGWYIYTNVSNEINIYQFNSTDLTGVGINTSLTETYVGRTTDPTGNLYLLTDSNIYKYDTDGNQLADQPINTTALGATRHLTSDQFGNVYVTCAKGIVIFDYDLAVKATLAEEGYEFVASLGDFEPIGYKTNW